MVSNFVFSEFIGNCNIFSIIINIGIRKVVKFSGDV